MKTIFAVVASFALFSAVVYVAAPIEAENKIPEWYQFYTKSNKSKWLPNWKPKYNLEKGIKKYVEYLNK